MATVGDLLFAPAPHIRYEASRKDRMIERVIVAMIGR
jgi:hypothetical protein